MDTSFAVCAADVVADAVADVVADDVVVALVDQMMLERVLAVHVS